MRKKKSSGKSAEEGLRYRLHDLLDVPLDSVSSLGVVEIYGGCEATITGARCVLKYDAGLVLVQTGDGFVRIEGENLEMQTFVQDRITVKGKILAVYPSDDKGKKEVFGC